MIIVSSEEAMGLADGARKEGARIVMFSFDALIGNDDESASE